jgi:two-component system, sensor histidine kinase LadS
MPIQIRTAEDFYMNNQQVTLIQAIYFGGIIVISLFSLFIFLRIRNKTFFYYALYVSCFGMAMFAKHGFARFFFWQDLNYFDSISQSLFTSLSGLFAILFTREFINPKNFSIKIDNVLKLMGLFYLIIALFLLASNYFPIPCNPIFTLLLIHLQLSAIVIIFSIWRAYVSGVKMSKLFFIAWIIFGLGVILSNLRSFGIIPPYNFTLNAIQKFSTLEFIIWSVALINTFFDEKKLKEEATSNLISAKRLLIETQKNAQVLLESKVKERTRALEVAIENEKLIRAKHMRFGAIISHEFRNPLAIIGSQTTLILKEQAPAPDSLTKRITTISSATNRLLSLFDKWIKNDRVSMLHNELDLSELKVYDLIEALFNKCKDLYPEHQFELSIDKANEQSINAHQDWLEMVIFNLVDNACKYSDPHTKIILQCFQENGHTCIAVVDHGIGIAPQFHDQIFNEYFRVKAEDNTFGLGLGLSLVKKIVDLHHATIDFISTPNQGSTFRICFNNI